MAKTDSRESLSLAADAHLPLEIGKEKYVYTSRRLKIVESQKRFIIQPNSDSLEIYRFPKKKENNRNTHRSAESFNNTRTI